MKRKPMTLWLSIPLAFVPATALAIIGLLLANMPGAIVGTILGALIVIALRNKLF